MRRQSVDEISDHQQDGTVEKLIKCFKCRRLKPGNRFRPGRLSYWACIRKYGSDWHRANRDRINEKRRWRYRDCRLKIRELKVMQILRVRVGSSTPRPDVRSSRSHHLC
jgi:hypothetical protein